MALTDKIRHLVVTNYAVRRVATLLLTQPRLVNFPGYRFVEDRYIRTKARRLASELPKSVNIQTTTACNARCQMCARTRVRPKVKHMSDSVWKVVLDRCVEAEVRSVDLQWFGEPFLDPKILDRMRDAKGRGLRVSVFTNGSLMNREIAIGLIEVEVDHINISIDGYSKETYEDIRRGLVYKEVVGNTLGLLEERKRRNKNLPTVSVCMVKWARNAHEAAAFSKFWHEHADDAWVANPRNMGGVVDIDSVDGFTVKGLRENPCRMLWTMVNVSVSGDVIPCCDDIGGSLTIGNLCENSLNDVWTGERISYLRRLHLESRRNEIPICSRCSYYCVWW